MVGMRGVTRSVGWLLVVAGLAGQDVEAGEGEALAELDALNHLTQAVAAMVEGASAESVRTRIVENLRHDPRSEEARRAVDRVVALCSDGARLHAEIKALERRLDGAAADEERAAAINLIGVVGRAYVTGGNSLLLDAAPTLLGDSGGREDPAAQNLIAKEQAWRRALAEVGLELERSKESVRQRGNLEDSDVVSLRDARMFVRTLRDHSPGQEGRARRELLLTARACTRFPALQYQLGLLYSADSPKRALGYFRRAVEQSGRALKTDPVAGQSALQLGLAALGEGLWSEAVQEREASLKEAAKWGRRCLKHQPRSPDGHVLTALAEAERLGEFEELLDVCLEVLEIDGTHAWARANAVDALCRLDRMDEALSQLDLLLRQTPEYAPHLLSSELVAESKRPKILSTALTPRVEARLERKGQQVVPVVRNTGRVPLISAWATVTYILRDGRRQTAVSTDAWARLDPGAEAMIDSLGWPANIQVRALIVRLYGANGFAATTIGDFMQAPAPFEPAASSGFQAWPPVSVGSGAVRAWFQVVRSGDETALLVCGRGALARKVQVGVEFTHDGRKRHHGVRVPAWDPGATLRIPLPPSLAALLAASESCTCYLRTEHGTAGARLAIEPGIRRLQLELQRITMTQADFAHNGEGGAPELFAKVYRNRELLLSTIGDFRQDRFGVQWSADRPQCVLTVTPGDTVTVEIWDKDVMDHDLLLRWELKWEHLQALKETLDLKSKQGTQIVFGVKRLH